MADKMQIITEIFFNYSTSAAEYEGFFCELSLAKGLPIASYLKSFFFDIREVKFSITSSVKYPKETMKYLGVLDNYIIFLN